MSANMFVNEKKPYLCVYANIRINADLNFTKFSHNPERLLYLAYTYSIEWREIKHQI